MRQQSIEFTFIRWWVQHQAAADPASSVLAHTYVPLYGFSV